MSKIVDKLLSELAEFEQTPGATGLDLRLSLADVVIAGLRRKGWSQKRLAAECGLKESFISRVLHSDANCTFNSAGKLLFALDIAPEIRQVHVDPPTLKLHTASTYDATPENLSEEAAWTKNIVHEG